jgi:hypothetical protein
MSVLKVLLIVLAVLVSGCIPSLCLVNCGETVIHDCDKSDDQKSNATQSDRHLRIR